MITRTIKNKLYHFKLVVFVGNKVDLNAMRISKRLAPMTPQEDACVTHWEGERYLELFVEPGIKPHLLAHECLHVAMHVLEDVGELTVSTHAHEPLAYLLQWIVERVDKIVKNERKDT